MNKLTVSFYNEVTTEVCNIVALCTDRFSAGLKTMACVNELNLVLTVRGFILVEYSYISADSRVHKLVGRKLNNSLKPVILKNVFANIAGTAFSVTRE